MVIHIPYKRTHTEPETRDSTHSRHTVRHSVLHRKLSQGLSATRLPPACGGWADAACAASAAARMRRRCSGEKVGFCQAKLAYTHLYTSTRDTNAPNRRSWAGGGSGTTNEASASVIDTPYGSALAESPFPAGDGLQQHSIVQKAMTRMADALLAWSNSSSSSRSTSVSHRIHACRAREGRSERYTPCQELA